MAHGCGDGGSPRIGFRSRGGDEGCFRGHKVSRERIADSRTVGLIFWIESPTEACAPLATEYDDAVAAVLLFEAQVVRSLSGELTPCFTHAFEHMRRMCTSR